MALEESSMELIRKAILENGFYFSKDTTVGERVEKMDEDATPFASASGLQFCKVNVLDNPVSHRVASTWFDTLTFVVHSTRPRFFLRMVWPRTLQVFRRSPRRLHLQAEQSGMRGRLPSGPFTHERNYGDFMGRLPWSPAAIYKR